MAAPARMLGTLIVVAAATEIRLSVSLDSGAVLLTSADAAYLTIPAGTYTYWGYLTKVSERIRQWIFNAETGDPAVDPAGAVADVPWSMDFSGVEGVNTSRTTFRLNGANTTPAKTLDSVTLINDNSWASPLGLCEDGTTRVVNASAGVVSASGDFQPRSISYWARSEQDTGDQLELPIAHTMPLADGSLAQFYSAQTVYRRQYTLLDRTPALAGPPFPAAWATAVSGKTVTLKSTDETVITTTRNLYAITAIVATGAYVALGGAFSVARVKTISSTSIALYEPLPGTVSVSSAGVPVHVIPEALALAMEAVRAGGFVFYGNNDSGTGDLIGASGVYAPDVAGVLKIVNARRDNRNALYSLNLVLFRNNTPGLTLP